MNAMALFSLILILFFSELANHSRESRLFSKFFPIFYQSRLFRFFTIAGYFTSETIKALSDSNITTFFIQKQGTNETQHIYFGGRRKTTLRTQHNITLFTATLAFSHHRGYK